MKLHSADQAPLSSPDSVESVSHDQFSPSLHHNHDRADKRSRKRERRAEAERKRALQIEVLDDESGADSEFAQASPGVAFCSRSEAICAELLQRYVPHFELKQGVTFQVAIGQDSQGNTLAVDFLVDGVLFEYHPVRFFKNRRRCGDFNSKHEYREYTDICHSLRSDQREFFQAAMRSRLTRHYYAKRRAILDQHPMYRRMELIVATSPEDFYFLVLKRFGNNVPRTLERFLAIFEELRESL